MAGSITLFILALLYFLLPWDLIPDMFGVLGRADDLLVLGYFLWRLLRAKQRIETNQQHETRSEKDRGGSEETQGRQSEHTGSQNSGSQHSQWNPYSVLGLEKGASKEEIEKEYRKRAAQYHPDKVAHLGPELRALAHEKMIEIQRAYRELAGKGA